MIQYITLTPDQARVIGEATQFVEVRDEQGKTVGNLTLLSPEDLRIIEHAKRVRALGKPGIPSAQVQAHLRRLEENRSTEGMDREKMHDLLHLRMKPPSGICGGTIPEIALRHRCVARIVTRTNFSAHGRKYR